MDHSDAVNLISKAKPGLTPSLWADLGCGDGTFTFALAELLPEGSRILAIDKSKQTLKQISGIEIIFRQADFTKDDLKIKKLDGLMMANSLHYVADKVNFIRRLQDTLSPSHWIIVEYERLTSNAWVPFPIDFASLTQLFESAGAKQIEKIGERDSAFGNRKIYASVIRL